MNKFLRIGIVAALFLAVVVTLVIKQKPSGPAGPVTMAASGLPRLVEIGSVSCIPCKLMAPILEELRKEYAGSLQVDVLDVNEDQDAVREFRVIFYPTQVFLSADGKELFWHEGIFTKEEILAKWKELGVNLRAAVQTDKK